ncbi:hypothetical protein DPMN_061193 [Dreissena polymorpha]|uniref:Uncharacterized protein n=1 Tax=Dreissena polymorpha TaxID=45954 RepID=A0A9D4C784_DREPO|nr:hypothetical protein DPMN_061193 [Dreissena polymorpha]
MSGHLETKPLNLTTGDHRKRRALNICRSDVSDDGIDKSRILKTIACSHINKETSSDPRPIRSSSGYPSNDDVTIELRPYKHQKEEWTKYGPLRDTSFDCSPTGRRGHGIVLYCRMKLSQDLEESTCNTGVFCAGLTVVDAGWMMVSELDGVVTSERAVWMVVPEADGEDTSGRAVWMVVPKADGEETSGRATYVSCEIKDSRRCLMATVPRALIKDDDMSCYENAGTCDFLVSKRRKKQPKSDVLTDD